MPFFGITIYLIILQAVQKYFTNYLRISKRDFNFDHSVKPNS
jgi:hypothetical protein